MGVPFAAGLRMLLDANQQFLRGGLPVYLRTENEDDSQQPFADLGFQVSASGSNAGFTDTLIVPQPEVTETSLHNIGLNQARLFFGARNFKISHSFVLAQMGKYGYTDPLQVWRNNIVIGLFYDNRLFSPESITHEDAGGDIIFWWLVCNASEQAVTANGG